MNSTQAWKWTAIYYLQEFVIRKMNVIASKISEIMGSFLSLFFKIIKDFLTFFISGIWQTPSYRANSFQQSHFIKLSY